MIDHVLTSYATEFFIIFNSDLTGQLVQPFLTPNLQLSVVPFPLDIPDAKLQPNEGS